MIMKPLRIVELVLLLVALVALIYVYFAFREHFPWLLTGFVLGAVSGAILAVLLPREWRKRKENP
jgi:hypothetical protein